MGKILNVAFSLGEEISSVVFPDYIREAKIGYNYEAKEIVVANMNFPLFIRLFFKNW